MARRDLIGHYIARMQDPNLPCVHACCRHYKAHPKGEPVILASRSLRSLTDEQLLVQYRMATYREDAKSRAQEARIIHEMERRDAAEERQREREARKAARKEATAATRAAMRQERDVEYERIKLDAEKHTHGYLVNARGRARGISDAEVLTGPEAVFRRYATGEAREYFAANPRPTHAYLVRGVDTRVKERAEERRRKPRGVVQRGRAGRAA